jgi:hypothetical protein
MQHEQHSLEATREEFLTWWTPQRREDLRRRFARYVQIEIAAPPRTIVDDCGG